ncbi:hypothetical protein B296_00035890 [Ensete ventricosum]|uniref:Uncharacterized protein n=1 Tax=Ensete ventricosum TaxID=4639 RepID=A0A426XXM7_ENSVE|nr:hypothetical protein B296_00035890 [Ensete ventricosum]
MVSSIQVPHYYVESERERERENLRSEAFDGVSGAWIGGCTRGGVVPAIFRVVLGTGDTGQHLGVRPASHHHQKPLQGKKKKWVKSLIWQYASAEERAWPFEFPKRKKSLRFVPLQFSRSGMPKVAPRGARTGGRPGLFTIPYGRPVP